MCFQKKKKVSVLNYTEVTACPLAWWEGVWFVKHMNVYTVSFEAYVSEDMKYEVILKLECSVILE